MEQSKLVERLEGYRRRNSVNQSYVNSDLYRLFYSRDLYIVAYNSIKSNDGADGTSLHGFCEEWITELISSMRDESYQPHPNRTTMIPKKNGKMRKLSFPNGKDKLVLDRRDCPQGLCSRFEAENQGVLKQRALLRLNDEKTKITHAAENEVTFLGYIIRKGTGKHCKFHSNPFDSALRIFMNTDNTCNNHYYFT